MDSTTQLPLEFAPGELLACGLQAAHPYPLVGKRIPDGIESWREPAGKRPWTMQLIEWTKAGSSTPALGFDCDSREAVERAAASCMGAGDLPTPNVYAIRTASGHAQVFYLLDRPVHRGAHARVKPLHYLARVSEFYRATLGADPGYMGVLSSNPVHGDYQTSYPRAEPYTLGQLAGWIPKHWRTPRVPTTAEGRNDDVFLALLAFAGSRSHSELDIRAEADRLYSELDIHQPHYFSRSELAGIVASVLRRRARWANRPEGWHQPAFLERQARKGRTGGTASGAARRVGTPLEHDRAPWAALGVSRRTWYRHFRGAKVDGENMGAKAWH